MKINVVLYHPEIPQNTGNIMRSCVGFDAMLHLIKPIGFSLDEKNLKRSCANYYEHIKFEVYEDFEDFKSKNLGKYYFLTRYGHKSPSVIDFRESGDENVYIIFGSESSGIAYDILKDNLDDCYRIPTTDKIRSLNLSNCAAIMLFLASEQLNDASVLSFDEPDSMKGKYFIENVNLDEVASNNKENK